ncbi:MAG: hypothetical protein WCX46_03760 [Candidatus Paceibacterota bacterium]
MQILTAPLESQILGEKSYFSADEEAAQTILSVLDTVGFSTNDYIILGVIGNENSEVCKISTTTTNTITVAVATVRKHYKDEPIQELRFNQRKFYRSTTESGTFTHLSGEGSPVNVKVDDPQGTILEDSTGTSTSWYKATYYNSTSASETSLDDATAVQAGDASHYTSVYKILKEAGLENNSYITTDIVSRYRDEAEDQTESTLAGLYSLPLPANSKMLQHIVTLLSAGFLLSQEYGVEADVEIGKTGERKIQRAEGLLDKILEKKIVLLDSGAQAGISSGKLASCSNQYNEDKYDKGSLFTLEDEQFRMGDPEDGIGSTKRSNVDDDGFE